MTTTEPSTATSFRRDRSNRAVAGVCAGIAKQTNSDVLIWRIAFIALAFAGGAGLLLYAVLWAFVPDETQRGRTLPIPHMRGRGGIEVGLGAGLLLLSGLLTLRALGIWWSDIIVWPVVLITAGGGLLWHEAGTRSRAIAEQSVGEAEEPGVVASRTGLGVVLVVGAGIAFLGSAGALSAGRNVLLSVMAVAVVLGVIFGPWVLRLARSLAEERAERIRTEERAEISAHLHDSVLQTLALVQQRAGDPQAVAALARRQERELRAWLGRRAAPGGEAATLGAALEEAADDVERDHGARVEVVVVGDAPLDERTHALVAAAREAMVNAAKFGGGSVVDVYAEVDANGVDAFVRDRGPGFEPASVAPDRRGVRESIVGRMERHGGSASISSRPGEGTEVELKLPLNQ